MQHPTLRRLFFGGRVCQDDGDDGKHLKGEKAHRGDGQVAGSQGHDPYDEPNDAYDGHPAHDRAFHGYPPAADSSLEGSGSGTDGGRVARLERDDLDLRPCEAGAELLRCANQDREGTEVARDNPGSPDQFRGIRSLIRSHREKVANRQNRYVRPVDFTINAHIAKDARVASMVDTDTIVEAQDITDRITQVDRQAVIVMGGGVLGRDHRSPHAGGIHGSTLVEADELSFADALFL